MESTVTHLTAGHFIEKLHEQQSAVEREKMQRYFKTGIGEYGEGDLFLGVRMGQIFELAKRFRSMSIPELEEMLESPYHEVRAGAISVMNLESRLKKITPERLHDLFSLYIRRHDRINNWDLVDLGCMYMTGRYLFDKSKEILYHLAQSANFWERRTAIVSTCYFIRQGQVEDTFRLSALLINDREDLVHKGVGWMLRTAGGKDPAKLLSFLDQHASYMPRTMLRYAIEKLTPAQRTHYLQLKQKIGR